MREFSFKWCFITERTKAGLEVARPRGRKGGRKPKLSSDDIKKAKAMLIDPDKIKTELAEYSEVSRPTLNKWLKQ